MIFLYIFGLFVYCSNNVEEISQIQFLAMCTQLKKLTLESNPVCIKPSADSDLVCFKI